MDAETQKALLHALTSGDRMARLAQLEEVGTADLAILRYVVKLTRTPGAMTADDAASLRAQGFDDRGIHDICAVAAYYAFVNRIADGLGVELES